MRIKKKVLFSSIDINAQYRLGSRLLPNSNFVEGLTYEQYLEELRLIFLPPEESVLWKTDYKITDRREAQHCCDNSH